MWSKCLVFHLRPACSSILNASYGRPKGTFHFPSCLCEMFHTSVNEVFPGRCQCPGPPTAVNCHLFPHGTREPCPLWKCQRNNMEGRKEGAVGKLRFQLFKSSQAPQKQWTPWWHQLQRLSHVHRIQGHPVRRWDTCPHFNFSTFARTDGLMSPQCGRISRRHKWSARGALPRQLRDF